MDLLAQALNGISYGSVLFLLAAGFTLTFGVVGVLNLAHGALFALGAFIGWTVAVGLGLDFVIAALAGGCVAAAVGLVIERLFLRRLRNRLDEQVLLTLGIALILGNLMQWIWGAYPRGPFGPDYLAGTVPLPGLGYPVWRIVIIGVSITIALTLWFLDRNTLVGARIRAGRDDQETLEALGINFDRLAMLVFTLGSFLAGLGGVLGAQLLGAHVGLASSTLLLAVVVVVIGGLGSVSGSYIGAMIIGTVDVLGRVFFPQMAMFTIFLAMIAILVVRPLGIVGRQLVRT